MIAEKTAPADRTKKIMVSKRCSINNKLIINKYIFSKLNL